MNLVFLSNLDSFLTTGSIRNFCLCIKSNQIHCRSQIMNEWMQYQADIKTWVL